VSILHEGARHFVVIASERSGAPRHCERSEAIQPRTEGAQTKMRHMALTHAGLLRRFAPRNDVFTVMAGLDPAIPLRKALRP
jgi:hypothetical protein